MFHEVRIEKNELVFLEQYKWLRNIASVHTTLHHKPNEPEKWKKAILKNFQACPSVSIRYKKGFYTILQTYLYVVTPSKLRIESETQ